MTSAEMSKNGSDPDQVPGKRSLGLGRQAHVAPVEQLASFDVLRTRIADGTMAIAVILAMALGLIVPKMCIEFLYPDLAKSGSRGRRRR